MFQPGISGNSRNIPTEAPMNARMNVSLLIRIPNASTATRRPRTLGGKRIGLWAFCRGIQAAGAHLFCLTRLSCRSRFHLSLPTPLLGAEPGRETRFFDRTPMKERLMLL